MYDDQEEDVNPLIGGLDNRHNKKIKVMFDVSAYLSDNKEEGNKDSHGDDSSGLPLDGQNHGHDVSQCWTYLSGPDAPEVSIFIDGVNKRLLNRACQEVPAVFLKMRRKSCGKCYQDINNFSPGDCFKALMDPNVLGYIKTNRNIQSDDAVSSLDLIAFICVELMISFY